LADNRRKAEKSAKEIAGTKNFRFSAEENNLLPVPRSLALDPYLLHVVHWSLVQLV